MIYYAHSHLLFYISISEGCWSAIESNASVVCFSSASLFTPFFDGRPHCACCCFCCYYCTKIGFISWLLSYLCNCDNRMSWRSDQPAVVGFHVVVFGGGGGSNMATRHDKKYARFSPRVWCISFSSVHWLFWHRSDWSAAQPASCHVSAVISRKRPYRRSYTFWQTFQRTEHSIDGHVLRPPPRSPDILKERQNDRVATTV